MLLTRARPNITPASRVTAELVHDVSLNSKKDQSPVKNGEEYINKKSMVAEFKKMKFTIGSSLKPVQMKFRVFISVEEEHKNPDTYPIETTIGTNNFIIITHTKQWAEAQGILIKKDLFEGSLEVTTSKFCNTKILSGRNETTKP